MRVFRISLSLYPIFDGGGAAKNGGRWNRIGQNVIYCAESLALCQIEMLVHIGRHSNVPTNHVYCEIHIPEELSVETFDKSLLPTGWNDPFDYRICQKTGSDWYENRKRAAILRVPSAVSPNGMCVLINQNHADFRYITATAPAPLVWDERLFR